jgi:hypothetical protein
LPRSVPDADRSVIYEFAMDRRGQPKIGMTIDEATATCWGKPRRVVKTTTVAGVQQDFIYDRGHTLRFENEKLSAILETTGQ